MNKVVLGSVGALVVCAGAVFLLPQSKVVAGFSTSLAGRTENQRHNAVLGVKGIDGVIVGPGQEFSFNRTVGSFSRDRGFKRAPVSYNGQLINDWGGGVCQTSTTLYNAALMAGMKIVERNRHQFCPSYVAPGRDAAVAFSNIDLRFVNPHKFPIKIHAQVSGDQLSVELLGDRLLPVRPQVVAQVHDVVQPESFVLAGSGSGGFGRLRVRNSGKKGYDVTIYRVTGDVKEWISTDSYPAMNRVSEFE